MTADVVVSALGRPKLIEQLQALERSTEPPREQLAEAYKILGFEHDFSRHPDLSTITGVFYQFKWYPVVEWVFRWLIKTFGSIEVDHNTLSISVEFWILSRQLLLCVPNNVAAKLFKDHKFVAALASTISWISKHCIEDQDDRVLSRKKRKVNSGHAKSPAHASFSHFLLPAICAFLSTIRAKVEESSDAPELAFSAENLKFRIRATHEAAAQILSDAFNTTLKICRLENDFSLLYTIIVEPLCWLWTCAFDVLGDPTEEASLSFSSICLVPSICLLSEFKDSKGAHEKHQLELLIKTHCIVPARYIFDSYRTPKDREPSAMRIHLTKVLGSILDSTGLLQCTTDGIASYRNALNGSRYGYLYSLAATTFSRKSLQQRTGEDLWLNAFLDFITSGWLYGKLTVGARQDARALLCIANANNITLNETLIGAFLEAGRLESTWDWHLIGLCFENRSNLLLLHQNIDKVPARETIADLARVCANIEGISSSVEHVDTGDCIADASDYEDALRYVLLPFIRVQVSHRTLELFLPYWKEQLVTSLRMNGTNPRAESEKVSVWEDERAFLTIVEGIESSMTNSQIVNMLTSTSYNLFLNTTSSDGRVFRSIEIQASIYVTNALLCGIRQEKIIDMAEAQAKRIFRILPALMSEEVLSDVRRYLWMLAVAILERWPRVSLEDQVLTSMLQNFAQEELTSSIDTEGLVPSVYEEACQAFNFLHTFACFQAASTQCVPLGAIRAIDAEIIALCDQLDKTASIKHFLDHQNLQYLGRPGEIRHPEQLLLAICASVSCRPIFISTLNYRTRDRLINCLFAAASRDLNTLKQTYMSQEPERYFNFSYRFTYLSLWMELFHDSEIEDESPVAESLRKCLVDRLQTGNSMCEDEYQVLLTSIIQHGIERFDRDQRVKIDHFLIDGIKNSRRVTNEMYYDTVRILAILYENPSKGMRFTNDLSKAIECIYVDESFLNSLSWEKQAVILSAITNIVSKSSRYLMQNGDIVVADQHHATADIRSQDFQRSGSSISLAIYCALVKATSDEQSMPPKRMDMSYQQTLEGLIRRLEVFARAADGNSVHVKFTPQLLRYLTSLMQHLPDTRLEQILTNHKELLAALDKNLKQQLKIFPVEDELNMSKMQECLVTTIIRLRIILAVSSGGVDRVKYLIEASDVSSNLAPLAQSCVGEVLKLLTTTCDASQTACFLKMLVNDPGWSDNTIKLQILEKLARRRSPEIQKGDELEQTLDFVLRQAIDGFARVGSVDAFLRLVRITDTMLKNPAQPTAQYHIDGALTSVATLCLPSSRNLPADSASKVYQSLCGLLSTLLARYRIRINGRHHLLIAALGGLLRCLYVSYDAQSSLARNKLLQQPSWLEGSTQLIGAPEAAALSRIIVSICEPPSSAVKRSKNKTYQELNDPTKQAKAMAGEYTRILMMEFCRLQLEGRLDRTMRDALNPGLYAIFTAMGKNVRKAVNGSLKPRERAVYKAAFDDWERFGRWRGE